MMRLAIGTGARRVRGLALLLAVTAFAMTGCLRYELSLSLDDDGSGVMSTIVAISDTFSELSGTSADELVPTEQLPSGARVSEYRQDGFSGIELGIPFANRAELGLLTAGMSAGAGTGGPGDISLEPNEDGGWTFSMVASLEPDEGTGDIAMAPPPELLEGAFFRIRVALPGELAEHNADRVEDGALVWDLDLTSTEPRQLSARTTASAPQPPGSGHGAPHIAGGAMPAAGSGTAVPVVLTVAALVAALALLGRVGMRPRKQTRG